MTIGVVPPDSFSPVVHTNKGLSQYTANEPHTRKGRGKYSRIADGCRTNYILLHDRSSSIKPYALDDAHPHKICVSYPQPSNRKGDAKDESEFRAARRLHDAPFVRPGGGKIWEGGGFAF